MNLCGVVHIKKPLDTVCAQLFNSVIMADSKGTQRVTVYFSNKTEKHVLEYIQALAKRKEISISAAVKLILQAHVIAMKDVNIVLGTDL